MSVRYEAVTWNRFKRNYDVIILGFVLIYLISFVLLNRWWFPEHNDNTVLIRAFGTLAILLLHLILAIGPAARLSTTFLPLLYNRRHLGVIMFLVAAVHGTLSLIWFHGGGNADPLVSLFTANAHYGSLTWFPFEPLGFLALVILLLMAATSHDLWLSFLGPRAWKALHMMVYLAYLLLVGHVALGILQFEQSPWLVACMGAGMIMLSALHILAARRTSHADHLSGKKAQSGWVPVGRCDEFINHRAKVVNLSGERIAIFNNDGALSAVHNVCKHQMGPLGEGRIIDGCITCPWHGFQYRPEDGRAPEPFHEKLHTYRLKREGDMIFLNPEALPEGTAVEPVRIEMSAWENQRPGGFFVGWGTPISRALTRNSVQVAIAFALLSIVFAGLFIHEQRRVSPFRMDYDHVKVIEGWLTATPVPMIRVPQGVDVQGAPRFMDILLSDAGKFGAAGTVDQVLKGETYQFVRLAGHISQRIAHCGADSVNCETPCTQCLTGTNDYPVMEIGDGGTSAFTILPGKASIKEPALDVEKDTVLHGEIVDPKCYFGAMNPGEGKTHLSCAARCLSGGIMPLLHWTSADGEHYAVLTGAHGEAFHENASWFTAVPVKVKGRWRKMDNWSLVRVDGLNQDRFETVKH